MWRRHTPHPPHITVDTRPTTGYIFRTICPTWTFGDYGLELFQREYPLKLLHDRITSIPASRIIYMNRSQVKVKHMFQSLAFDSLYSRPPPSQVQKQYKPHL